MQGRDNYIDILKGLGIILVIWGHSSSFLFDEIYAFHMPLFFFLSGCFFSTHLPFIEFTKKKIRQLIIPYIIFYIISCIYYWILLGITGRFSIENLYSLKGLFPYDNVVVNGPLWFFYALFWMSLLYYLLRKSVKNDTNILIICLILHITAFILNRNDISMPAYTGRAFNEIIYMHIGYILYNKSKIFWSIRNSTIIKNSLSLIISITIFSCLYSVQTIIGGGRIYYSLTSILTAISGIALIMLLGSIIKSKWICATLEYLGRHTLCLFSVHLPLYEISRPIAKMLFDIDSIGYDLTSFIIVFILSIIGSEIMMLIFPKYLGKSSYYIKEQAHHKNSQ